MKKIRFWSALSFFPSRANNLDEFFEVRVAGLVQQIEDGYTEAGPDGLTLLQERDLVSQETHEFVDDQYRCWNEKLRPMLAENGIRVLGLHELDAKARAFVDEYLREGTRSAADAGHSGSGASFSARDQQGSVRGISAAPSAAFLDDLHRSSDGTAGFASPDPFALRGNRRFHFPGRPRGLPCLADVSRL